MLAESTTITVGAGRSDAGVLVTLIATVGVAPSVIGVAVGGSVTGVGFTPDLLLTGFTVGWDALPDVAVTMLFIVGVTVSGRPVAVARTTIPFEVTCDSGEL